MLGKATLTIVTSRKAMNTAAPVTSRTFQRRWAHHRAEGFPDGTRSSFVMQRTLHENVASRYSLPEMLPSTYDGQHCSIARSLELLGERWTLLVIRQAFLGTRRFE